MNKSKVKRALSIDMDIIGWKSLALYNDLIGTQYEVRGEAFWEELEKNIHIGQFIKIDDAAVSFVRKLLEKVFRETDKEKIFFVQDHDMILEQLCAEPAQADEVLELYNIDHHHDIFYQDTQKEQVERFDFTSLGDWVYYLGYHDKIERYYWIKSPYSIELPEERVAELTFPMQHDIFSELPYDIMGITFDYVCICKSPDYLPIAHWKEFDKLIDLANKEKNTKFEVWTEMYCKNEKSRHIPGK